MFGSRCSTLSASAADRYLASYLSTPELAATAPNINHIVAPRFSCMSLRRFKKHKVRMSNRVFNLDDPHNINNFLVLIGASPVASPPEQNDTDACRLSPVTNAESQAAGTDLPVSFYSCVTLHVRI